MLLSRTRFRAELRRAYIRGLGRGYRLARKLETVRRQKEVAGDDLAGQPADESPAFMQQIRDIARQKDAEYD